MQPLNFMAIWAITSQGANICREIARQFPGSHIYLGDKVKDPPPEATLFQSLQQAVNEKFGLYRAHVFVMATGIAVRMIAPHVNSKLSDPAVLVVDDSGRFVISLLSGHLGGANSLTLEAARVLEAIPVITTATDNARVPAIDQAARQKNLFLDNPRAVKEVSMAFLAGERVDRFDPGGWLDKDSGAWTSTLAEPVFTRNPGIMVHHRITEAPEHVLVLRPRNLYVGIGCNRGTTFAELLDVLHTAFDKNRLSIQSINLLTTIMEKTGEPGLLELSRHLRRPLTGFTRHILDLVRDVPNPSLMVHKHMGVKSVCEAAAMTAANQGTLLVPKIKSGNVTVAVASCT
ncbi:cobalt-precorrin 5A hydrolase [Desulfonatronospira sp.]|uniref:cobalt-precorrin 5A hydrolase n=1 Tax=Desulfonatronospira sp. TaxID=1962951 RepID=UPI0025BC88A8|nr:cobalt-precorrin 5A hydrolase [Desulfonatronospira sp.]